MTQPTSDDPNAGAVFETPARLPRRDIILLPLTAALTVVFLLFVGEGLTRVFWPDAELDACVSHDPELGPHGKPNCTSTIKTPETTWITTHYNDCGFRSETSCKPVPPGTPRVTVIGASTSGGYLVQEPDLFTNLAAAKLSALCGKPVDVQNTGIGGLLQDQVVMRLDEAFATKPNVLVWVLVPFDIENVQLDPQGPAGSGAPLERSLMSRLHAMVADSRMMLVAQHYFYRNLGLYTKIYLGQTDRSGFLRPAGSPLWQRRLAHFERNVAAVADRARAEGATFLLVLAPQQAQAAMMTMPTLPDGVDPLAFGRQLGAMVEQHGGKFLDVTSAFARNTWNNSMFYPVDGHFAAGGNHVMADDLVTDLVSGAFPAFASCHPTDHPGSMPAIPKT